jgi:hypothetical protein
MTLPIVSVVPKGRFVITSFPKVLSTGPPSTTAASATLESPVIAEKLPPKDTQNARRGGIDSSAMLFDSPLLDAHPTFRLSGLRC